MTDLKRQFDEQHGYGVRPDLVTPPSADLARLFPPSGSVSATSWLASIERYVADIRAGNATMRHVSLRDVEFLLVALRQERERTERLEAKLREHQFCDVALYDHRPAECFDCTANVDGRPHDPDCEWNALLHGGGA